MANLIDENGTAIEQSPLLPISLCFSSNHNPSPSLLKILHLTGMDIAQRNTQSLEVIKEWTQKNLLRKKERWDQQTSHFEALRNQIIPALKELGLIDPILPRFNAYHGAILHGALLPTVRFRVHWLIELWKQGIRFTDLYMLGGQRPLHPEMENLDALLSDADSLLKISNDWIRVSAVPTTEIEMMRCVWEQAEIPEEMRSLVKVHFISAPMKTSQETGISVRPNTEDTIIEWLKKYPLYGRYLSVSNAPYIQRQGLILQTLANENYLIDPTGPGIKGNEQMAILLDELARLIFSTFDSGY